MNVASPSCAAGGAQRPPHEDREATSRPAGDAPRAARGRRVPRGRCELSSPRGGYGLHSGATITHIFGDRHWRKHQQRCRGHSTTWALSQRGHSRHAHLLGTSAREAALSWLVGGVPTPPSRMAGCSGTANDHMVSLRGRRRRLLRSGNVETHTSGCRSW